MLYAHLVIFFLILPIWCRLSDGDSSCYQQCFHQPAEACPKPDRLCRCRQLPNCERAAICCNVNNFTLTEGLACGNISRSDGLIEALHIRNATLEELNVSQPIWRRLRYMTITDGQIQTVSGEFAKHTIVSCLNLSSNGIRKFDQRSLGNLFNLSYLDLAHNNLSAVPRFKKEGAVTIDISANPFVGCLSVEETLKRPGIYFSNENTTVCKSSNNFQWFKSTEKVALSQVKLVHQVEKNCFGNCTCMPYRLDFVMGKPLTLSVSMNCSGVNLMSLPTPLPPYTIYLDVSNNNISSLKELSHPSYQSLVELRADNNQIESIQPLEGTKFINNFLILSLRRNKITKIETYILSNLKFYRILVSRRMNLGLNKLHCDCSTAMEFRVWLLGKLEYVPDYKEIECEGMDVKVIDLDQTKLCQAEQDWTDYIYFIITVEVLLLVGLIVKMSYDYWVFKTAGYLPWPANKMPRLPCDWLCE